MTESEILTLIKAALKDVAPDRAGDWASVSLDSKIEELALDSIATMEMVGFLEDSTDKTFPDEELNKVTALRDLGSLITRGRV